MTRLQISLLENASGFFEDALANAVVADEKPIRWKYAILSIVQAIELSMKELLFRQHPILIFRNIDNPDHTVGLRLALDRLRKIAKIEISESERETIKYAAEMRNHIVHYRIDADIIKLKLSFARLIGFLNDFHRLHFNASLSDSIEEDVWKAGIKISEYGEELFRRAKNRIAIENPDDDVISCPRCGWESLVILEANAGTCYVCGTVEDIAVCDHCHRITLAYDEEYRELGGDHVCEKCFIYLSDDYWYESSAGK